MRFIAILMALCLWASTSYGLPSKVYLNIPFLCQAPYGNWSQPWQDACEEAAVIMAMAFVKGDPVTRGSGNQDILKMVAFQEKQYGGHFDLTAKECVKLINDYYKFDKVELKDNFTIEDIKTELAQRHVVIAPMAGRMLRNPYYTPPGPAYHYIVFKGYDERSGAFITNDAGTRRGKNFRYKYQTAYNAIHDWTGSKGTVGRGRKAIIVIK